MLASDGQLEKTFCRAADMNTIVLYLRTDVLAFTNITSGYSGCYSGENTFSSLLKKMQHCIGRSYSRNQSKT